MLLNKKTLQNLFLIIIAIMVSINAGINSIIIQISSICFVIFFLFCLNNNEVFEKIKNNYLQNKNFFFIFFYIYKLFNFSNHTSAFKFN